MRSEGDTTVTFAAAANPWQRGASWTFVLAVAVVSCAFPKWELIVPWSLLAMTWARSVRGYTIRRGELRILLAAWKSPAYSLAELKAVQRQVPGLLEGSLRALGTGLFTYAGLFRHRERGWYRAFVTDRRAVVWLQFGNSALAVSPADPDAFVEVACRASRHCYCRSPQPP